jgi:hypothetical protein
MGTFEDFIVKIKEAASFAGKKTGEAVEVSKLRISATETQNKIDREFTALGKKIYDAAKEQTDCTDFVRGKVRGHRQAGSRSSPGSTKRYRSSGKRRYARNAASPIPKMLIIAKSAARSSDF